MTDYASILELQGPPPHLERKLWRNCLSWALFLVCVEECSSHAVEIGVLPKGEVNARRASQPFCLLAGRGGQDARHSSKPALTQLKDDIRALHAQGLFLHFNVLVQYRDICLR